MVLGQVAGALVGAQSPAETFMLQKKPDASSIFPERQEVVSVYLYVSCKQTDALLSTRKLLLNPVFFVA